MFKDIEAGVYPDSRRYYLPLFAAAYSSTYEGQLNYADVGEEDRDAFEESWSVTNGAVTSTYTKDQGIATTTGRSGTAPLNALVQKILSRAHWELGRGLSTCSTRLSSSTSAKRSTRTLGITSRVRGSISSVIFALSRTRSIESARLCLITTSLIMLSRFQQVDPEG